MDKNKEMKAKFSKQSVKEVIQDHIEWLRKEHEFDPSNGWKQVEGKGEEKNRAYGEYSALCELHCTLFDETIR